MDNFSSFETVHLHQLPMEIKHKWQQLKQIPGAHLVHAHDGTQYGFICAGPMPNSGYRLELLYTREIGDTLIIHVRIISPKPGEIHLHVITYPCIIGKIPSTIKKLAVHGINHRFTI
jgi:hypothetical protein